MVRFQPPFSEGAPPFRLARVRPGRTRDETPANPTHLATSRPDEANPTYTTKNRGPDERDPGKGNHHITS